jgi:O-antigen/teichoic acid export membrane protein
MGQVFFNRISAYKNQYKPLFPLVKRMLINLISLSVVPFGIIFFWGEELFAFVFGESWRFSGRLSEIMAPWLMLNFITSPLSTLPLVLNRQRSFFVLGITLSVFQLIGFWYLPKIYGTNEAGIETVFQYVTWSQVVLSSIIALYLLWIAKKSDVSNPLNAIFKSK